MGLPKIQQPLFELTVPSTEKKVKYRPFTVKEEKILLIAQESEDVSQILTAIKQIINNCVQDVDVDSLSTFDVEYIFIMIRSKSIGNEIELTIKDPDTEESVDIVFNIDDVKIVKPDDHNRLIKIDSNISLYMSYPKLDDLQSSLENEENISNDSLFNIMMGCIESVINGDEVYLMKDFSKKEVDEFIESLSSKTVDEIKRFFETTPKIRFEKKYKNKNGDEKTFVVEGTEAFFM